MRIHYLFPLIASLSAGPALAATPVSKVVVYADRAEVTRTGRVACSNGGAELAFENLPLGLDERTLRADVDGKSRALGVTSRVVSLDQNRNADVAALEAEIRGVEDELTAADDELAALEDRAQKVAGYAGWFMPVWQEAVRDPKPDPGRWTAVLDFLRSERETIVTQKVELAAGRLQLERRLDLLRRRLAHLSPDRVEEARTATVAVDCRGGSAARVSLSYVVPGATWHPEYDLRFLPATGKVGQGTVELTVAAVVQQATGEDWEDAQLVLSTAKPRLGSEAPRPAPLWVDGHEVGKERVLVQATERRDKLQGNAGATGGGPESAELEDRGQSFFLELPRKVTVHADGRPYWMPVDVRRTTGQAGLVTIPKLAPFVYQVVRFDNPAPYPLLAGRVHVHRRGSFVGDVRTEYRAPGEPMELSLGLDEELKVERIDLLERDRRAGFLSGTKHMDRAYRVEVASRLDRAVTVEVRESIPVSKVDDVRVVLDAEKTTQGYELDAHRGFLTWKVKLQPGAEAQVDLGYAIHLPESWEVR